MKGLKEVKILSHYIPQNLKFIIHTAVVLALCSISELNVEVTIIKSERTQVKH